MATQLSLNFPKNDKFVFENFIPHTGVIDAVKSLTELKRSFSSEQFQDGKFVLVFGPAGSGKTHLVRGIFPDESLGRPINILDFDVSKGKFFNGIEEIAPERFVALFQALKLNPSILFVLTSGPLIREEIDPHIYSRLVSGEIYEISYPSESELLPVLKCILERHGMRLEDKELLKIINQVPAVPECFTTFCKDLDSALSSGKKFKPSIIKSILSKQEAE